MTQAVKCDICGSTAIDHTESQCKLNCAIKNSGLRPHCLCRIGSKVTHLNGCQCRWCRPWVVNQEQQWHTTCNSYGIPH